MKTKGRPQSQNIQDRRSPFGSQAVDPGYYIEDRFHDFLMESIANPYPDAPQPLMPLEEMSEMDRLIWDLMQQGDTE